MDNNQETDYLLIIPGMKKRLDDGVGLGVEDCDDFDFSAVIKFDVNKEQLMKDEEFKAEYEVISQPIFPVIFTQTENVVLVEVPDLEILTEGSDMADAIDMARDAIGLKGFCIQNNNRKIPTPSKLSLIDAATGTFADDGESIVSLVDVDFSEYRRRLDNKE